MNFVTHTFLEAGACFSFVLNRVVIFENDSVFGNIVVSFEHPAAGALEVGVITV
jgi:hypothetical protein